MAKKATNGQINKRIMKVVKLLCRGADRQNIIQYASNQWDISDRHTDTYIKRANKWLKKEIKYDRKIELHKAIKRYTDIFKRAYKEGKYTICLKAQKELAELLDIKQYKPFENKQTFITQINQNGNEYNELDDEDLKEEWNRRQQLVEKLRGKKTE